jgi:hypothetical protein
MGRHLMNNTSRQSIPNILRRRKTGLVSVKTSMSHLPGGNNLLSIYIWKIRDHYLGYTRIWHSFPLLVE